ncbi:enoyl-ACP reductase FabI [Roseiarcus fermentans]|nr:enoyl-ACP reductase FabI [Roseiarcus fermentans]
MLTGKKGLVVGVANDRSIGYGCARHFRAAGAELAMTYLNSRTGKFVLPLASALECQIARSCDVAVPGQLESVFEEIARKWGRLDFALHSIGYARADDLHGRVIDCSAEGFAHAMLVSVHSFLRLAKLAEPLMTSGGCLLALTYYGGQKAVQQYGVMGPVKGALETAVAYMALELGGKGIRVNAISPGPVATRSASGISHFDQLLDHSAKRAPEHRQISLDDVGALAAFLVSDAASAMTGNISYVDGGYHVMG